jgi:hypothetical protein
MGRIGLRLLLWILASFERGWMVVLLGKDAVGISIRRDC